MRARTRSRVRDAQWRAAVEVAHRCLDGEQGDGAPLRGQARRVRRIDHVVIIVRRQAHRGFGREQAVQPPHAPADVILRAGGRLSDAASREDPCEVQRLRLVPQAVLAGDGGEVS